MLASLGRSAVMPVNAEQTKCYKQLWVLYDLSFAREDMDGIFDELRRDRKYCAGYLKYQPTLNPKEHVELAEKRREERLQWRTAILGFIGALFGAFLGTCKPN